MTNELRVFISSTFSDLQAERDQLVKHVFPRVRRICRERGVEFTEIDLRWGITDEESMLGRVIGACMDEIDRCRPYFIGILGSRYGWSPSLTEVQKDGALLRKYPWIEDAAVDGASLLDMEFSHALLMQPASPDAVVFFRDLPDVPPTVDTERLAALRTRLTAHGVTVRPFNDPVALGDAVAAHLLSILDHDFPSEAFSGELGESRRSHTAFAAARRHAYVARQDDLARLTEHADRGGPPLVIVAPSGVGKSALLAFWSDWYQRRNPAAFVISHFVGVGAHADDVTELLRHCLLEIKERCGFTDAVPQGADAVAEAFPLWLARAGPSPMIILIDAVNQLGDAALRWMPSFVPAHVRFIVTTTPGTIVQELEHRGCAVMQLQTLPRAQREAFIVRYLGEYRKGVNAAQCARMADDPKSASPLFLRTMLEELRIGGAHEVLDARIDDALAVQDVAELFQNVLARIERDHGAAAVRAVFSALWASRSGLRDDEIAEAASLPPHQVAALLNALEYHLVERNGLHTFFHEFLREAVETRYVPDDAAKRAAHARLATYFASRPLDARRAREEPWQWRASEDWAKLRSCLTAMPMFALQYSKYAEHELLAYWMALGERADMVTDYRHALDRYRQRHTDPKQLTRLTSDLGKFFIACSRYAAAETMLNEAREFNEQAFGASSLAAAACRDDLGGALYYQGNLDAAEIHWRAALDIREQLCSADDPLRCESLDNLAAAAYQRGVYVLAESLSRRSLAISELAFGANDLRTSARLNNLASALKGQGRIPEALAVMLRAVEIKRMCLGDEHPEIGRSLINLGLVYANGGDYDQALECYLHAERILSRALGESHDIIATLYQNLALLEGRMGRYGAALQHAERSVAIREARWGDDHPRTLEARCARASILVRSGKTREGNAEFALLRQRCEELGILDIAVFKSYFEVYASGHRNSESR